MITHVDSFEFKGRGGGKPVLLRQRPSGFEMELVDQYQRAIESFRQRGDALRIPDELKADGVYVMMNVDKETMSLDSFDMKRRGPKTMSIRDLEDQSRDVALYVSSEAGGWFQKKVEEYGILPRDPQKQGPLKTHGLLPA